MNKHALLLTLFAATLAAASPARALTPPPPPPQFGAYGPLRLCEGDIAIDVRVGEGVHVVGSIFRVIDDKALLAAMPAALHDDQLVNSNMILLDNFIVAYRYAGALPDSGRRDAAFAPQGFRDGEIRYAIATNSPHARSSHVHTVLIVGSPSFDGSDADKAILSRLRPGALLDPTCARPSTIAPGQADARFETTNWDGLLALYPQRPVPGPLYHCQGGIGFAVHPGESLRRPWKALGPGWDGPSYVTRDGVTVRISGPRQPLTRIDPNDAVEHPMGLLRDTRITYYKSRGVGPPYAPTGVREDGSWRIELGKDQNSGMEITFPASDKTPFGFRFLERLEYVSEDDPRCGSAGRPR